MVKINAQEFSAVMAGNVAQNILFAPGPTACEGIKDGVSFDTGDGWWVIAYTDLLEMCRIATEARDSTDNKPLSVEESY